MIQLGGKLCTVITDCGIDLTMKLVKCSRHPINRSRLETNISVQ
jgi:hypothetical protein